MLTINFLGLYLAEVATSLNLLIVTVFGPSVPHCLACDKSMKKGGTFGYKQSMAQSSLVKKCDTFFDHTIFMWDGFYDIIFDPIC